MSVSLSLIICTYNREKFLPDCLDSLANQKLDPGAFEIVLINNNSTDSTHRIAGAFLARHPELNVQYHIEEQQGLSHARNRGLAESRGQILTFFDDDAIAMPDAGQRILDFFEAHPQAFALGGKVIAKFETRCPKWFNRFSASLYFSHYDKGDRPFSYRGQGYPIGCNMSFRREVFDRLGGFDVNLGRKGKQMLGAEEKDLFARIRQAGMAYYYDPSVKVYHQIAADRVGQPYMDKLAFGLGQTHRMLYCERPGWACFRAGVLILLKFIAAIGLALGYLLGGRPAVFRHLIDYRWKVVRGFFGARP